MNGSACRKVNKFMRLTVIPVGNEKQRLFVDTGLGCWHYNGEPVASVAQGKHRDLPIWLFRFACIEEEKVKRHMIATQMSVFHMNERDATIWLESHFIGIPQFQVVLELTESGG